MLNHIRNDHSLSGLLHPQSLLDRVGPICADALRADRVGVALPWRESQRFDVFSLWDRRDDRLSGGYSFPVEGTAGGWVRDSGCPLVGERPDDMTRFPQTYDYLRREQFASNLLLPVEAGRFGRGAMFLLSRKPEQFSTDSLTTAARIRDVLDSALQSFLAAQELFDGTAMSQPSSIEPARNVIDEPATLEAVERRHIESVLTRTNGIVEGPRGAAKILGLNPSTLRNRMRKLGIQRPGG